ncbi:NUDIX domain-containing protein [Actinokineospora sp. PR83]|uniref:NUDIX domain-containing protein n=1 Tax=Actinokineospora sp. PR83 TaxID=2884908 RepID=UPI001F4250DD|nr:NUDIX domain-containing protein [Actinokineospora sp. PR83]MCG8919741.1 NUDIX domain-containing protein [Actinokineospora sp. PR83]
MAGPLNPVQSDTLPTSTLPTSPALDWRDGRGAVDHAWVPEQLYRAILERMPVVRVDTLITRAGEALLTRRSQEPQAGSLWLQGGRVRRGEQLTEAAVRTAEQESGLDLTLCDVLGTFSTVFGASAHGDSPTHTVNVTFLAFAEHDAQPRVDSTHDDFVWWPLADPTGNPYLDQLFALAVARAAVAGRVDAPTRARHGAEK